MQRQVAPMLLLCIALVWAFPALAQSPQSTVIVGPSMLADECDTISDEFYFVLNNYPNGPNEMTFNRCLFISYPSPSLITQQRTVIVPTGNVVFQFFVAVADHGSPLHTTYSVTVTAKNTQGGDTVTNTGSVKLFGSLATDAPAGAVASHFQATATSPLAFATLNIPLPLEFAESVVTFQFNLSEGQGTNDPIQENLPNTNNQLNSVLGPWTDQGTFPGPDVSSAKALTIPGALTADQFVAIVTPAAQFQLPVVPVAILYAPLGNTGQASASYQLTTTSGSNLQLVNSQGTTTAITRDDKTSYTAGLTLTAMLGDAGSSSGEGSGGGSGATGTLGFTVSGSWDSSVESDTAQTSSTSDTIVTVDQVGTKWSNPASGTTPLNLVAYATQPFWQDVFLVALNTQFSAWDYPDAPVLQPLGNVKVVALPLKQMVSCASTPNALQTPAPAPDGSNADHFASYAPTGGGANVYIWLGSDDCTNILSLDQFYVQKTQSAVPLAYRVLSPSGSFDTHLTTTYTAQSTTNSTAGQDQKTQYTSKVTSIRSNSLGFTAGIAKFLGFLGINLGGSDAVTVTSSTTTTLSYETVTATTLSVQTAASTAINDGSGIAVNGNVYQDAVFQGLAVQDNDMHFAVPALSKGAVIGPGLPCGAGGVGACAQAIVPPSNKKLPVIKMGQPLTPTQLRQLAQPHVEQSSYASLIVEPPIHAASSAATTAAAAKPKAVSLRPLNTPTPPAAAFSQPVDPNVALQSITALGASNALVAKLLAAFKAGLPELTISETVSPAQDIGLFDITLDGTAVASNASSIRVGPETVSIGTHTVGESGGNGTNLAGYKVLFGGDCPNGAAVLTLGDRKNCVIQNLGQPPHCPTSLTACGNQCVSLATNAQNCGKCGNVCANGLTCQAGSCGRPACPPGYLTCCGGDVCSRSTKCPICP